MRIVMIGHSNAGKTTFISQMYALLADGHWGFRLRAGSDVHDAELRENAARLRAGTYPPPSSRRAEYSFTLSKRKKDILTFDWNDYRGGALVGRTDEEDTREVLDDLGKADGLVVFADAHRLASGEASAKEIRRLTVLAHRAIEERDSPVPFVLAYTKSDLVPDAAAWGRATEPFAALEKAAADAPHIANTVVRLSCGAKPVNVKVPALWCLAHGVSAKVDDLRRTIEHHRQEAADAAQRASGWNSVKSWWNNETSWQKIAENHAEQVRENRAELRPLKSRSRSLSRVARRAARRR